MISSTYNKEKQVLFITLQGVILLEEVELLYQTIVSSSVYPSDIRSLWDFREADFTHVTKEFIAKVFAIRKKYPERGAARAAFVADQDLAFGVSRMYEVLSSFELPQHIQVFRDYAQAEEWILAE